MELDWLKDFLALAEQRNFSRAADIRNVTQPAFSRRIRALEEWIGTPLFVRSAQGATLTPAGAYLRPLVDEMLGSLQRVRRETRAVGEREMATLSIAATHTLSFTFFPGWNLRHVRLERLGSLNLISDSMAAASKSCSAAKCISSSATITRMPDAFAGRPFPEHPGRQRRPGPGLLAGHREPTGLAASWHTGKTAADARLQPSL